MPDPFETLEAFDLVDDEALRLVLADVITDVTGVVRLEPTLKNVISRFAGGAARTGASAESSAIDGITVTTYGQITDVKVELAVDAQARATAVTVQERVRAALAAHGREPGVVAVNVLALERS